MTASVPQPVTMSGRRRWLGDSVGRGLVEIDVGAMMLVVELAALVVDLTMLVMGEDATKVEEVKGVSWPHF